MVVPPRKTGRLQVAGFVVVALALVPTAKPEEQITTGYAGVVEPLQL